jgi:hypothetical protein
MELYTIASFSTNSITSLLSHFPGWLYLHLPDRLARNIAEREPLLHHSRHTSGAECSKEYAII